MFERKPYVSPEYEQHLAELATTLMRDRGVGAAALDDTVEMQLEFEIPDNIEIGEE